MAERDRRVNQLGNLTLVTKRLNGSLSNRPWTDGEARAMGTGPDAGKGKRSLLEKYSLLVLSRELTSKHPDSWNDADIESTCRYLAERICHVWPGPPSRLSADDDTQTPSAETASSVRSLHPVPTSADDRGAATFGMDGGNATSQQDLLQGFEAAMKNLYVRAKDEAGYEATVYLRMLADYGGLETARRLLATSSVSDGFVALWERGRVDLAVENVVLRPEFSTLFSDDELDVARRRLREYGLDVD